jgi:hypothetical protein
MASLPQAVQQPALVQTWAMDRLTRVQTAHLLAEQSYPALRAAGSHPDDRLFRPGTLSFAFAPRLRLQAVGDGLRRRSVTLPGGTLDLLSVLIPKGCHPNATSVWPMHGCLCQLDQPVGWRWVVRLDQDRNYVVNVHIGSALVSDELPVAWLPLSAAISLWICCSCGIGFCVNSSSSRMF